MSQISIKYDPQTDTLRLRFTDTAIEESDEAESGLIVDYDAEGHVVGVELLDASTLIERAKAARSTTVHSSD